MLLSDSYRRLWSESNNSLYLRVKDANISHSVREVGDSNWGKVKERKGIKEEELTKEEERKRAYENDSIDWHLRCAISECFINHWFSKAPEVALYLRFSWYLAISMWTSRYSLACSALVLHFLDIASADWKLLDFKWKLSCLKRNSVP